jgi:hypothetical protein
VNGYLYPPAPFILPTDEHVDVTGCESSQATPAENTASSDTENEKIVPVSNAEVDAEARADDSRQYKQLVGAT